MSVNGNGKPPLAIRDPERLNQEQLQENNYQLMKSQTGTNEGGIKPINTFLSGTMDNKVPGQNHYMTNNGNGGGIGSPRSFGSNGSRRANSHFLGMQGNSGNRSPFMAAQAKYRRQVSGRDSHGSIADSQQNQGATLFKSNKKKYELKEGEEFVEYFFRDGKRMKKIRRTEKKIKNLTMEEINEITEAFNLFDKDGSKTIDVNELRDALKVLGINMNLSHTKELMEKADKDGSGTIELNEFKALMAEKIEARNPKEELRKAFNTYDEDDNKLIDLENLEAVSKELGIHVPHDELRAMIQFADTKGNGTVDLEDFMRVMRAGQLYDDTEKLEEDMEISKKRSENLAQANQVYVDGQ